MANISKHSEKSIFLESLEIESKALREEFLRIACADDESLRRSVDELLQAHERENPLDQPLAELKSGKSHLLNDTTSLNQAEISEDVGTIIGPYKLMELIGEGGFALVFVADQQQPIRRRVALKLIKPGMDSREFIARFEAERQALALMESQNIAKVYDAGTTATGRPYFVMELVRGVPITEYCERNQLGIRERLELFATVCEAVQHAHQKGVIHRDIKPSNVLVTLHDERPVVKVIDFGVAKAIGQTLTDKTIYTRFASMIGTPLYMSPEQAEMSGLDVDTRSDIFSLGVLLYELLTCTTPFDRERFDTVGFDEVRRIIREEDPPKPSTRLTTLHSRNRSTVQGQPGAAPSSRVTSVPVDLDWIVMKAIEKDRRRRYDSAGSLTADVRRFLNQQPIEARPPSRIYKIQKFARRNKAVIATASLVSVTMIVATAVSVWYAAQAIQERDEKEVALENEIEARKQADEARRQLEEFADRLKEANILVTSGRAHADEKRWAAAYADYTQAIERQPNHYNAWIERASLEARLGLWQEAAEDYSRSLKLGIPVDNSANWGIPQLLLFNGDRDSYRTYCLGLLSHAKSDPDGLSPSVIRGLIISPEPVTDPGPLADRMEEFLSSLGHPLPTSPGDKDRSENLHLEPSKEKQNTGQGKFPHRGKHMFEVVYGYYIAGLAHYRAGEYELAAFRLEQVINEQWWPARPIAYPVLAMAYQRSGEAEKAQSALKSAEAELDNWTTQMLDSSVGEMPVFWFDWIDGRVLFREATILLTGFAPADDPRLRTVQSRARDALQEMSETP